MNRYRQKFEAFVSFADSLAGLTCCRRGRVGAILFDNELQRVEAIGFNGPSSGMPNDSCDLECCACSHAEANCLIKARGARGGLLMYVTKYPCPSCAGLISNSKVVAAVVYRDERGPGNEEEVLSASKMLRAGHVALEPLERMRETIDQLGGPIKWLWRDDRPARWAD